jgi:hypothetical protein
VISIADFFTLITSRFQYNSKVYLSFISPRTCLQPKISDSAAGPNKWIVFQDHSIVLETQSLPTQPKTSASATVWDFYFVLNQVVVGCLCYIVDALRLSKLVAGRHPSS